MWVLRHLSKGQLSKETVIQGDSRPRKTYVQGDFCQRRHLTKETVTCIFVQGNFQSVFPPKQSIRRKCTMGSKLSRLTKIRLSKVFWNVYLVWVWFGYSQLYGYLSHFKLDFDAVKSKVCLLNEQINDQRCFEPFGWI